MEDINVFGSEPTARAPSLALSDISELTTFTGSPSPGLDYQEASHHLDDAVSLTPQSTLGRSRAANGRFTPRNRKRTDSPDTSSPSKKPRSLRESSSPTSAASLQRPQDPRCARRYEDAVRPSIGPVHPTAAPWIAGRGGCGTLEVIPKEIRQTIYGFAFSTDEPITVKKCCGLDTTVRERGACKKHGRRIAIEGGRFNILRVSKTMRLEASWVVLNQGRLLLRVGKALAQYLGCYRWNGQRHSPGYQVQNDRKARMWAAVGKYRHVKIEISTDTLMRGDPVLYISSLVDVALSLCQSWAQISSPSTTTDSVSLHTVEVHLGDLFQAALPFNAFSKSETYNLFMWTSRYVLHSWRMPNFDKMAADSGRNLLRLVAVVDKYRRRTEWKFFSSPPRGDDYKGGRKWLMTFQAECAKHGMLIEHSGCV